MGMDPSLPFSRASQRRHASNSSRAATSSKVDPSFKSKRYRDKLREQIKALENLLPVDKATLHRKLDSQTVFRLAISFFRIKSFIAAAGLEAPAQPAEVAAIELPDGSIIKEEFPVEQQIAPDGSPLPSSRLDGVLETQLSLEAFDGFLLVVTADGTILYTTDNISSHLGFHHVDLVHRCIYGIVHPDDHDELRVILEETLSPQHGRHVQGGIQCPDMGATPGLGGIGASRDISFLCRMKCFNGTNTGYVKMLCNGTMKSLPDAQRVGHAPLIVMFAAFRPFVLLTADTDVDLNPGAFWSTHDLDLNVSSVDGRCSELIGIEACSLENKSLYQLIYPDDLLAVYICHKTLIETEEVHTMFFRLMRSDGSWQWLHSRGRAVSKNGRKTTLYFAHCPVRKEDIPYLGQEAAARARYGQEDLQKMFLSTQTQESDQMGSTSNSASNSSSNLDSVPRRRWMSNDTYVVASQTGPKLKDDYSVSLHSPHGACPSTFHQSSDQQTQDSAGQGAFPTCKRTPHQEDVVNEEHNFAMNVSALPQPDFSYAMAGSCYNPPQYGYSEPLYGGFDHQPLSMYQMVAHLPPEMYDAESYRKHALRMSEMQQEEFLAVSHARYSSQYHLPPTPQTSPPSAYPVEPSYHLQYMPTEPMCGATAPPSPPPSPIASGYHGSSSTPCMITGEQQDEFRKSTIPSSLPYPMDCCTGHVPSRTEYCASYIVNGAVQVKLVSGTPTGTYSYGDYDSSYVSPSSVAYAHEAREPHECEKKPFQQYGDKAAFAEWESMTRGAGEFNSVPDYHQKKYLPCPLANTKSGCLAQKMFRSEEAEAIAQKRAAMFHQSAISQLPPIGSFLDFLNEELNAMQS
ncbi:uncharacterized protein [Diadema setosum]|uniref:uncharacterized protein n=1 Tax=Diadema setosum TaxID=31175 RepID=UPI003B3B7101